MMKRIATFRTRILLIVAVLAVFPLLLTGFWLSRSAVRAGEDLLEARLNQYADALVSRVRNNWIRERSALLSLADDPPVQSALRGTRGSDLDQLPSLERLFDSLSPAVARATVIAADDRHLWTLERNAATRRPMVQSALLVVNMPIHQRFPATRLGRLEAHLDVNMLLAGGTFAPPVSDAVLGAFDRVRGTPLLPTPFDPLLLEQERFMWAGDEWLSVTRTMTEPPVRLVVSAPLSPFVVPFETTARTGALWLAVLATLGLVSAFLVTRRLTRRLERLAVAADAVSGGDFHTHVDDTGADETGRVAQAFNAMTANLSETLEELASRKKLATLGEFAATLAHEIRNPLTAIRLDLQQVEAALPPDSPLREAQCRALTEIARLDTIVAGTLSAARVWPGASVAVDLRSPIDAAVHGAEPAFRTRGARLELEWPAETPFRVIGNPHSSASLEQLFLNLLLNAAVALGPGGRAWLEVRRDDDEAVVEVRDTGTGIPGEIITRVFEPLYSTRADGTGLGLTVAQRIVEDHQGRIELQSQVGLGTTVRVALPLVEKGSSTPIPK